MRVDWSLPGFTELARLGEGGFGRVVLARRDATGEVVAIKYLFAGGERAQFRHEAAILRRVVSPFVAQLHAFVETPEGAAIVMEAVPGVSLRAVLKSTPVLAPESALVLLKGSLLGLAAAHTVGTVHRDYKPGNVLVQPNRQSKLVDFGIALLSGHSGHSGGTPAYMAPEQWQGAPATPATDVYAATCVFFQCVTGARPFEGSTTDELRVLHQQAPPPVERAPEPVRALIARGMAKAVAHRPAGAAVFVGELEAVARAGYGREWETTGWHRLAEFAGALLAVSPMAWVISATGILGPTTAMLTGAAGTAVGGAASGGVGALAGGAAGSGAASSGAGAAGGAAVTNTAAGSAGTAIGNSAAGTAGAASSAGTAGGIAGSTVAGAGTGAAGTGALAGGAAGGAIVTGVGAAGTTAAAGLVAAKVAAVVIAITLVVGGVVIVTNTVGDDPPAAADPELTVDVQTLQASYDVNLDVTADVVQVSGHPDRTVEERIDRALQDSVNGEVTALREHVAALRELLAGEDRADEPVATTIDATVLMQNDNYVSVRYANQPTSDLITNSSWQSFATVTVDLRTGETVDSILRPGLPPDEAMTTLAQTLIDNSPDGLCASPGDASELTLTPDDLGENVLFAFTENHAEFTVVLPRLGHASACGIPTVQVPYDDLANLLDPDLVTGLTAG